MAELVMLHSKSHNKIGYGSKEDKRFGEKFSNFHSAMLVKICKMMSNIWGIIAQILKVFFVVVVRSLILFCIIGV